MAKSTIWHPAVPFYALVSIMSHLMVDIGSNTIDSVWRALEKLGVATYPDLNSPNFPAVGRGTLDIVEDDNYHRHSSNRAFLPPELTRDRATRLKICCESLVTRVAFSSNNGEERAVGVYFEAANPRKAWKRYYAGARREIVVCAGALGSPQILMLRCDSNCLSLEYTKMLLQRHWSEGTFGSEGRSTCQRHLSSRSLPGKIQTLRVRHISNHWNSKIISGCPSHTKFLSPTLCTSLKSGL